MKFEFVEDVYVDDLSGTKRVLAKAGDTFDAELKDEEVLDRHRQSPEWVKTGRKLVVSSDVDALPGCLTSCIHTGRAVPVGQKAPEPPAPKETAPTLQRLKNPKKAPAAA